MRDRAGQPRLCFEALDLQRIGGHVAVYDLEGDLAPESDVFGAPDRAHAALTEPIDDAVVLDGAADQFQVSYFTHTTSSAVPKPCGFSSIRSLLIPARVSFFESAKRFICPRRRSTCWLRSSRSARKRSV